jgi:beta-glucosidase
VERGELSIERLNDACRRLLSMKYDQGLFEKAGKMDPAKTAAHVRSKAVQDFSQEVAHKALLVVRDPKKLLPVSKDKKVLVVEQVIPYSFLGKDLYSHPHMFCEQMTKHSTNLILDDTAFFAGDEEVEEALNLAKQADLVVMTNYYARIEKRGNNRHLVKALKDAGHTVIVVTNFPYRKGVTKEADAVICNFSGSPDSIRVAADLVFGAVKPYPTRRLWLSRRRQQRRRRKTPIHGEESARGKRPPYTGFNHRSGRQRRNRNSGLALGTAIGRLSSSGSAPAGETQTTSCPCGRDANNP